MALSPRRRRQAQALAALGIVVGCGATPTLAAWTGSATASATLTAATVSLGVGATAVNTGSYVLPLPAGSWYPGMSQAVPLVLKNSGSIAAPFAISGSLTEVAGGGLGAALAVTVTDGAVTGTGPASSCSGTVLLSKPAGQPFPSVTRPSLAAGAAVPLCVQVALPAAAPTTLQGRSTTVALSFVSSVGS